MVRIARSDGLRIELELDPISGGPRDAKRLFDRAAEVIQKEWKERSRTEQPSGTGQRKKKRDLRWLKVTAYAILVEMLRLEQDDVFEIRIKEHRRYPRGQRGNPNRFQLGLMALFAEQPDALNPRDRERLGKQFQSAYRHYVPPEFLLGFLSQMERGEAGEKFTGSDLRRDFRDWIIERRASDIDHDRGDYPLEIEQGVEKLEERSQVGAAEGDPWA